MCKITVTVETLKLLPKIFKLGLTIRLKMVSTTRGDVNHDPRTDNEDLIENVWNKCKMAAAGQQA